MRWSWWTVPLLLAACSKPQPPIPQERFVEAVVALRQAAREAPAPEAFAARREAVLREAGVTEAQLRAFVRHGTREPKRLADAWDSVAARLSGPEPED